MPDSYDRFVYPDFEFPVPKGEAAYRQALTRMFPHESAVIEPLLSRSAHCRWLLRAPHHG